ncbi:hypothetical protein OEZ86_006936 [Tetradesmus obliquus]|nr:hypothetical protein OEZ86_006936 [Tetradesmus obliquus]
MGWRQTVKGQILDIKDAFEAADGGPGAGELQREVTWVLDDVIAAWREQEQQQWQPCCWQQLELELQAAGSRGRPTGDWQVLLRAPLQQLQQLWRLRLQERVPFQYLIHTAHWRDLVLSMQGLQAEVGQHEPWSALDGGPEEGLDSLQVICSGAADMLLPGGFLALETAGSEQAPLVQQLLQEQQAGGAAAFRDVRVHEDCYGVPRFVSATRN